MNGDYNIRDFGARGDGLALDTDAIQQAVDCCGAAGGGRVLIPPGTYRCGTVFLRSNITIHLMEGSLLLGSDQISDYGTGEPNPQMPGYNWEAILFAKGEHNVAVTGRGRIEGQGGRFPAGAEAYSVDEQASMPPMETHIRPSLLYLKNCTGVRVEDVSLLNAAQFATLFEGCTGLRLRNVTIDSRQNLNTDGFHLIGCRDIHISGCDLSCGDDAIVLNRSCESCIITDCIISSRWAGIRIGPFSSGKLRNILVSHCIIRHTYGCALKLQMGEGGVMEDIRFQHLLMEDVTGPISVRLCHFTGWQARAETPSDPGTLRNITFSDIRATVAAAPRPGRWESPEMPGERRSCICIEGCGDVPVENIVLREMHVTAAGGGLPEEAVGRDYPVVDNRYPEYFLAGTPPAYGLFARAVQGLRIESLRVDARKPDARPALLLDNVKDYTVTDFCANNPGKTGADDCVFFGSEGESR